MLRRLSEVLAMAAIGEGIVGLYAPRRHLSLWRIGPQAYRKFVDRLIEFPTAMRILFAAEIGLGLWWAVRQLPESPSAGQLAAGVGAAARSAPETACSLS